MKVVRVSDKTSITGKTSYTWAVFQKNDERTNLQHDLRGWKDRDQFCCFNVTGITRDKE